MRVLVALVALILTSPLAAQSTSNGATGPDQIVRSTGPVGILRDVTGTVTIGRAGRELHDAVVPGYRVDPFDLLSVSDGRLVVELAGSNPGSVTLTARAGTRFAPESAIALDLLAGSITVEPGELAADAIVVVRTGSLRAYSHGPSFTTTIGPDGAVLIASRAGLIGVDLPDGSERFVGPENALEIDETRVTVRSIAVADPGSLRERWLASREALLTNDAVSFGERAALRYATLRDAFDAAYAALMERRPLFDGWIDASYRGSLASAPGPGSADESAAVDATLADAHRGLLALEPLLAVLLPATDPSSELGTLVRNDAGLLTERFAETRWLLALAGERARNAQE